ncbi:energy-coupling factor transporter ATP-binding protein EcfA2 [Rhodopseudomonas rhenobacensis]|uniref:Energy-coupling factor transporter ATP-binding protein EcfA2 n=1 Tax=Rhodopseudomonas rhenobacensis TaxID=87461 RepID=A0A7W8DZ26_9BRAD|nr:hypothetical protein [Rhodopseudomonas rhenobacensis]MBB5047568.1 energy-coupling factor transporter ATP-binding protein EcfA2 [Rhodopseudomonas rhenobacensis]
MDSEAILLAIPNSRWDYNWTMGDRVLAPLASVFDALKCARTIIAIEKMIEPSVMVGKSENADGEELPLDGNFIEQAEYIQEDSFNALSAEHPDEDSIVRRLSVGGAKLLVGPRGCGKTTLMLKAYYSLLRSSQPTTLPVYVNFKLSLKLEPLYAKTPNATFWFRQWLTLKIYEGLLDAIKNSNRFMSPPELPSQGDLEKAMISLETGSALSGESATTYTMEGLSKAIVRVLAGNDLVRCVLLMDDAAHAFSPRQQEDFFEFFREIKSREISPKAAVYPGITTHSPTFHVGHDAEQIDVWIRPDGQGYLGFMRTLAERRFGGELPIALRATPEAIEFLAYASFGIPRSFLNMLRTIYHDGGAALSSTGGVDRRRLFDIAKQSKELSHGVYESLAIKIPAYSVFVETGQGIYQKIIEIIKSLNRDRPDDNQALEFGLKKPVPPEIEKVLSFFQYAGLVMPVGENSRGVKGVFELYTVHYGDLITQNALIGRRTKTVSSFVAAFKAPTHQAWPRISPDTLVEKGLFAKLFRLTLPHCQSCGAERASENARFCQNCGSQLKTSSLYDELVNKDISVLPLSNRLVKRIKAESTIRTVKDILMDVDRSRIRSVKYIGPVRTEQIVTYAEEYIA